MSIFESIMLICFGFAWPFQIHHSYVSRTAKGKSAIFSYVVIIGYAAGILHKVIYSMDNVIYLYIADLTMVVIDLMLYYRNRALDRKADAEQASDR